MKLYLYLFVISVLLFACKTNDDDTNLNISCSGDDVVISDSLYQQAKIENYHIEDAVVSGTCLSIKVTSSGCDGKSWKAKLIDLGDIAESYPVQRWIKLDFENDEMCDAVFTRTYTFNLSSALNEDKVKFHLYGWNQILLFETQK